MHYHAIAFQKRPRSGNLFVCLLMMTLGVIGGCNQSQARQENPLVSHSEKSTGPWSPSSIIIRGNLVEQWVNGSLAVSVEIGSDGWKKWVSDGKYAIRPEYRTIDRERIVLQDHGDAISMGNFKLKELK